METVDDGKHVEKFGLPTANGSTIESFEDRERELDELDLFSVRFPDSVIAPYL